MQTKRKALGKGLKKTVDEKAVYFSQKLRERVGENIRQIVLFGSHARGDARAGSDYDFMVVLNRQEPSSREEILKIEVEFLNRFDEVSSCLIFDEEGWKLHRKLPIGLNIEREGVVL